jgi:acyl-CoA synthetase (AMP-forming)/AMP-acid ligase II/acyl carrier protein
LRTLLTGGDKLHLQPGQALPFGLANNYGPTENTVVTTWAAIAGAGLQSDPAIGRPIDNASVYLLDPHLQPVPIGVIGELYIGGAGLARGYLNRPDLTAESFIPNPFSSEPGARLYKSGDLARYLPDGNIEFVGRIDHQVKIRGCRVELGEIETVLGQHPAVRQVVVVAREEAAEQGYASNNRKSKIENPKSEKRLIAYVAARREFAPTVSDLRGFLRDKLPEYMVPSVFVILDALPLSSNGKIDRKALPAPDQARPDPTGAFVAPRTRTEELLAGIWTKLLHVEKVGTHDNFFDLGGHSLIATRVISRLREEFRVDLPLRSLFESPTVAGLAERIETLLWAGHRHQPAGAADSEEREEIKL